jgi:hypothetical protein
MRDFKAVFAAGLLAILAAASARAFDVGIIKTYDASQRNGTLTWEGGPSDLAPVFFQVDPGVPVFKAGDRVRVVERPTNPGLPPTMYQPMLTWVTGLAAPGDAPPPDPYAALKASFNKPKPAPSPAPKPTPAPVPAGTVKTFDAAQGAGTILLDGRTAPVAFRPWPAFAFTPKAGDRLRYAFVSQWGTTVLWAAPLADADAKP